ncbi:MAG: RNA polymerase sigma factor [Nitrospirota bacterium]
MDEDLRLIEKYCSGNEEALEELVLKYQKQVYGLIYRMTNDIEEAKDLTQKTFLNVIKGIKDFRRESSFKTWLYRIAINVGLNHRKSRHEEVELEELLKGDQPGALSRIIEKERRIYIRKSLAEIPERQRLALLLRVYEGLSLSETAQVMGCSEGAVKANYHNAVKRLKEILKVKGYETKP